MPAATAEPPKTATAATPPAPDIRERLGIKKRAAKPVEPPVVPDPKAPPATAAQPKPAPKKKAVAPPAPPIDTDKLGAAIAEGIKKGTATSPPPAPDKPKEPELSPTNKRRLQILERMAKDDPESKELPAKFLAAVTNEAKYRKDWEAAHPKEKFDPESPDHEAFFSSNDVEWDEDAYELARENVIRTEAAAEAQAKIKPEFDKMDARERARAAIPAILTHQATTAKLLFDGLGADFAKVLKPTGEIDHEEIKRLTDENPIYNQVFPIADHTEKIAGEIYRIANGIAQFEPKNKLHAEIADFVTGQEESLKKLPAEEQQNPDGKLFATAAEWSKMDATARAKHWHFTEEHLSSIYAAQAASKAKKIISDEEEKFKNIAEKRGYSNSGSQKRTSNTTSKTQEPPITPPSPPPSPAGVIAPRMAAQKNGANNQEKSIFQRLRGVR